ncbi:hypothetical protein [uncultured Desulfovibrio sp.]|uniref:hypothetical protein n=1 Tax=uncultured Desulfovibrio sp. TaxID=167968 RepID=UPI0026199E81|nr:hypothetical protein [uncultured Desulfovibrio sp.]
MSEHNTLICAHCGVSFVQTTHYTPLYCSDTCARAGRNKNLKDIWHARKRDDFEVSRETFIFSSLDGYLREASPFTGF